MPGRPSKYVPHIDAIRKWSEQGKSDDEIALLIPVDNASRESIRRWRRRFNIRGPLSPKYPLDEWFNGEWHLIEQGKDFDRPAGKLRSYLFTAAGRRRGKLRTEVDGKEIRLKFTSRKSLAERKG